MPQLNILSLIGAAVKAPNAAAGNNPQAVGADEGFAPMLSEQVVSLARAAGGKAGGVQGEGEAPLPGLVASFLQRLSIVVSDDSTQDNSANMQQQGNSRHSSLMSSIIQLLQQQGQGVASVQNTVATLTALLQPEQVQELANLLQVSVEEVTGAIKQLITQSANLIRESDLQKPVSDTSPDASDDDEESIFDPATLLAPDAASEATATAQQANLQPAITMEAAAGSQVATPKDISLPFGVLIQDHVDPVAVEKIQALFGDALLIMDSTTAIEPAITNTNPVTVPSLAIAATQASMKTSSVTSLPGIETEDTKSHTENTADTSLLAAISGAAITSVATPHTTAVKNSAEADTVDADMDILMKKAAPRHASPNGMDIPAIAPEAAENDPIHKKSTKQVTPTHSQSTPVTAASQNRAASSTKRDAAWQDDEGNVDFRLNKPSHISARQVENGMVADVAAINERPDVFARESADSRDTIGAIREAASAAVTSKLTDKIRHQERAYLRPETSAPMEQVFVRIRDLPTPGNHRIQIQLDPNELGKVDVTMDVTADGRAHITMTVDKRETMELLQRDRSSLEKALSEMGLKTDSGGMSFNLREQPKGQQQAGDQNQQNSRNPFGGQDVLPEELREEIPPMEPYRGYILNIDESVNISV